MDEIFASLHGMTHLIDYQDFGRELRQSVLQQTSLTCGVGIAPTKRFANVQLRQQKYRKTQGVVVWMILSVVTGCLP